jgi:hypothetical protein
MSIKDAIRDIVGKKIVGVVFNENDHPSPTLAKQVFLVFEDGTNYEIYGDFACELEAPRSRDHTDTNASPKANAGWTSDERPPRRPTRMELIRKLRRLQVPTIGSGECANGEVLVGGPLGYASFIPEEPHANGPTGGHRLGRISRDRLRAALRSGTARLVEMALTWERWREKGEPGLIDAIGMVKAGCEPDRDYYRLSLEVIDLADILANKALNRYLFYSETEKELQEKWESHLAAVVAQPECRWENMDRDDLEWAASEFELYLDDV